MSRLQRIRKQAMSLRGGLAVGGALAIAVSLTQVAGTLAATDLEPRTAKVPIATANYYPTPLPKTISCDEDGVFLGRYAVISWADAGEGMKYRVRIIRDNDDSDPDNVIDDFYTTSTSHRFRTSSTAKSDRVRIHTVNIASGATDATRAISSGYVSHTVYVSTVTYTYCSGAPRYDAPNQDWEEEQSWSPEVESFGIGQPLVSALNELGADADGIDDELAAAATLDDAAAKPSKTEAPEAKSAETTTAATGTSTSVPRTSSSTSPTAAPAERSTTSSSSTSAPSSPSATSAPPSTTKATSSTTASSAAPTTTRATTTSTTVPATSTSATAATTATPVALPGGGEAKLVGGTTLVVSDDDGPVCSATVREGSTLKVRSGVLEVTDTRETREVDPQTCELT